MQISERFGVIFFNKGGYDVIAPYQTDPNCVNIWFNNISGEKIYYQGKFVNASAKIPDGYTLTKFPSSDYFVTTTEWLPSYEETMNHINHDYYKNAQTPAGYKTRNETDNGIFLIDGLFCLASPFRQNLQVAFFLDGLNIETTATFYGHPDTHPTFRMEYAAKYPKYVRTYGPAQRIYVPPLTSRKFRFTAMRMGLVRSSLI